MRVLVIVVVMLAGLVGVAGSAAFDLLHHPSGQLAEGFGGGDEGLER